MSDATALLQHLDSRGERIGAVVLAGGLARRMGGQDKGLILLGGRPMASWVLDVVKPQVHEVLINANRHETEYVELGASMGASVIADRHTGHLGPLAGLSAALHELETDYVFMCPCDSPFLNAAMINTLGLSAVEENVDIAVASDGERMQPVFSVVHRRVLASLDTFLDSGERKIDRWYRELRTVEADCTEFSASFRNINTEEERLEAEQSLMASS